MQAIIDYAPRLWEGFLVTLQLLLLGSLLMVIIAFTAGLARLSRHWFLRWPAALFIEIFRGTSMIVQLFWVFYALPFLGLELPAFACGVAVLALNEGAYAAEIVRGAIKSRPPGQNEACVALSIPPAKRLTRILIPQSIPAMLPPFGNVLVDLLKNSALVSAITVLDLTYMGLEVRTNTGETTAVFTMLLVVYFLISLVLWVVMNWLERRFAIDRVKRSGPLKTLTTAGVER